MQMSRGRPLGSQNKEFRKGPQDICKWGATRIVRIRQKQANNWPQVHRMQMNGVPLIAIECDPIEISNKWPPTMCGVWRGKNGKWRRLIQWKTGKGSKAIVNGWFNYINRPVNDLKRIINAENFGPHHRIRGVWQDKNRWLWNVSTIFVNCRVVKATERSVNEWKWANLSAEWRDV